MRDLRPIVEEFLTVLSRANDMSEDDLKASLPALFGEAIPALLLGFTNGKALRELLLRCAAVALLVAHDDTH